MRSRIDACCLRGESSVVSLSQTRGGGMRALVRLMTVPPENGDAGGIEESLQAAIELEMSTIPPYLYAAWSIDVDSDPSNVREVIAGIAREEMLHLGIACNLLAAVGGHSKILSAAPRY